MRALTKTELEHCAGGTELITVNGRTYEGVTTTASRYDGVVVYGSSGSYM